MPSKFERGAHRVGVVGERGRKNVNPFTTALGKYNLLGNKHIPQDYISNSEEVRLKLLAGLLDTDGTMDRNGYDIIQKRENLAHQIKFIADSLGFRTSLTTKQARIGDKDYGIVYRVFINGDVWRIPCKVKRKIVLQENCHKNKDWHVSQVTIEKSEIGDWCGIQLDGNQRYLHADGTVTHNSGKGHVISNLLPIDGKQLDVDSFKEQYKEMLWNPNSSVRRDDPVSATTLLNEDIRE